MGHLASRSHVVGDVRVELSCVGQSLRRICQTKAHGNIEYPLVDAVRREGQRLIRGGVNEGRAIVVTDHDLTAGVCEVWRSNDPACVILAR